MACKQKRGPGFKYASNLPGSLLREQKAGRDGRDDGDQTSSATASVKRKTEREETPRLKNEDLPSRLPPLLSPSGLPRPRSEVPNFLRKKRKLFDDDEEEDEASTKKKVTCMDSMQTFFCSNTNGMGLNLEVCYDITEILLTFYSLRSLGGPMSLCFPNSPI